MIFFPAYILSLIKPFFLTNNFAVFIPHLFLGSGEDWTQGFEYARQALYHRVLLALFVLLIRDWLLFLMLPFLESPQWHSGAREKPVQVPCLLVFKVADFGPSGSVLCQSVQAHYSSSIFFWYSLGAGNKETMSSEKYKSGEARSS